MKREFLTLLFYLLFDIRYQFVSNYCNDRVPALFPYFHYRSTHFRFYRLLWEFFENIFIYLFIPFMLELGSNSIAEKPTPTNVDDREYAKNNDLTGTY